MSVYTASLHKLYLNGQEIPTVGSAPPREAVPPPITREELELLRKAASSAQSRYAHALRKYKRWHREHGRGES